MRELADADDADDGRPQYEKKVATIEAISANTNGNWRREGKGEVLRDKRFGVCFHPIWGGGKHVTR